MAVIPAVIARLNSMVPALGGRVAGAADLARLMASQTPPQVTPAAHVYPGGLLGGRAEPILGFYRQDIERLVSVLITVRSQDQAGARALDQIEALLDAVTEAVAGWAPTDSRGVFVLRRAQPAGASGAAFSFELTFSIPDDLRILT